MSRPLAEQIKDAERLIAQKKAALEEAEGRLDELLMKRNRYKQRSIRKQHRKKYRNDLLYRVSYKMSKLIMGAEMQETGKVLPIFEGIASQLEKNSSKS